MAPTTKPRKKKAAGPRKLADGTSAVSMPSRRTLRVGPSLPAVAISAGWSSGSAAPLLERDTVNRSSSTQVETTQSDRTTLPPMSPPFTPNAAGVAASSASSENVPPVTTSTTSTMTPDELMSKQHIHLLALIQYQLELYHYLMPSISSHHPSAATEDRQPHQRASASSKEQACVSHPQAYSIRYQRVSYPVHEAHTRLAILR